MGPQAGEGRIAAQEKLGAELEAAFAAGEVVVVCWEPGCTMHRLPHWPERQWVSRERLPGYPRYSHGICRWHYQTYRAEVARYAARRRVLQPVQTPQLTAV